MTAYRNPNWHSRGERYGEGEKKLVLGMILLEQFLDARDFALFSLFVSTIFHNFLLVEVILNGFT